MPRDLISVVDDDESVRESLPDLLRELGYEARGYASAESFLRSDALGRTRCLILDVAMSGMSGPALYEELLSRKQAMPVVYITAQADEKVRAALVRQGAAACLFKPFSDEELRGALAAALEQRRSLGVYE